MSLPTRTDRAQALARSYGGDRDGWERVEEYQRVLDWQGQHPDRGSSAASSALDLPRGRIRPWFDGAKPDPVHAIDIAEQHGWLDTQPGERTFEALSILHAWVLAGGSIDASVFTTTLALGDDDPCELGKEAVTAVGFDPQTIRPDDATRGTEIRPAGDGRAVLGRFLHAVLDAPVGPKNERSQIRVPAWLRTVSRETRLRWSRVYVTLRGTAVDDTRHGYALTLQESRSPDYRESLADVFSTLVEGDEQVTATENTILLRPQSAELLDRVPELP